MTLNCRSTKWAMVLFASLALLVLGAMAWASMVTVRLARADRLAEVTAAHRQRVRLAVAEMESWANQLLFFDEFSRPYWHYAAFHRVTGNEVRFPGGELLSPGAVSASPLFLDPPRQPWLMLHFQVSPTSGYTSPQLVPALVRRWPGFEADYDSWDREVFGRRLAALEAAYNPDDLAQLYQRSRYIDSLDARHDAMHHLPGGDRPDARNVVDRTPVHRSDFDLRRERAQRLQRVHAPQAVCASERIAFANIFLPDQFEEQIAASEYPGDDALVGIVCGQMRPAWVRIAGRRTTDLMYLRPVSAASQTAWQGFVLDWPAFSAAMLHQIDGIFDDATLQPLPTTNSAPPDESVFSIVPARLVTPVPVAATGGWSRTYTFLLIGWAGALTLLAAVGLGLVSLVRLTERRTQFAYAVTHELRTPLTTFRLYTDMLSQGLVRSEDQPTYIKTLNDESKRLADLVNGVLEYSRIENNSVPINKEPVKAADIIAAVTESYESHCASCGMRLLVDHDSAADATLLTDRQLAVQIIGNLVDNACKYGRNPDHPVIEIRARRRDDRVCFTVRDFGPGIPAKKRSSIFRPYNRAEAEPATAVGGVGLGLALSRSWARLLGGQLDLVTEPDQRGATFRVTLGTAQ